MGSGEANYIRIETQDDWDSVREWHHGARKLPAMLEDAKSHLGTEEIRLVPSNVRGGYAISYTTHNSLEERLFECFDKLNDDGQAELSRIAEIFVKVPDYQKKD